jgi:hypothetical protein
VKISKFRTSKRCSYPDEPTFYNVGPTTPLQSMVAHEPLQSFFIIVPISIARVEFFFLLTYITTKIKSLHQITSAWLAQSVERETLMFHFLTRRLIHLHLKVAGSTPASGLVSFLFAF